MSPLSVSIYDGELKSYYLSDYTNSIEMLYGNSFYLNSILDSDILNILLQCMELFKLVTLVSVFIIITVLISRLIHLSKQRIFDNAIKTAQATGALALAAKVASEFLSGNNNNNDNNKDKDKDTNKDTDKEPEANVSDDSTKTESTTK